jgi:MFS family permease
MSEGTSVGYLQLIRQNDRFRRLWIAQLISAAGDWFNSVAVLGLVLQLTNSGLAISLVVLCSTLPAFFLIPVAGPVADRFDRRTLMIVTNVLSAGIALLFLIVHAASTLWLLYVATIMLVVMAAFFAPASAASIPNIVSKDELFSANALGFASWGVMVMVGSAVGGIVSATFGREAAFVINALSFLVAALIIATVDIPSPKAQKAIAPWRDFAEGLAYLRHYLPALALVGVKVGWGLAGGVIVLISVFGEQVFKAGDAGIGFLYSARGLGALVGPFVVRALVGRSVDKSRRAIWIGFLLSGIGYAILAISGWFDALWLACIALFVGHFGGGIIWALSGVLLQLTTPDRFRGRVFAVDFGLNTLTTGLSTLTFGLALEGGVQPMALALLGAVTFCTYGVLWGVATSKGRLHLSEETVANGLAEESAA